jgi:hypothetical protein
MTVSEAGVILHKDVFPIGLCRAVQGPRDFHPHVGMPIIWALSQNERPSRLIGSFTHGLMANAIAAGVRRTGGVI